jgi:predicted Zn-dependent peptidase
VPIETASQGQLANGLRVVLRRNTGAPLTHLSVAYELGSASPERIRFGQALREILPRIGTRHLSAASRDRLLLAADTSVQRTRAAETFGELVQTVSIPPDTLPLALFIEADRMGFGAQAITQPEVDEALARLRRLARLNEEPLNGWLDDIASGTVAARCVPDLDSVVRIAAADLQSYARRYLQPGNATLVIEGDFETKDTWLAIERTFGRLQGASMPEQLGHGLPVPSGQYQVVTGGDRSLLLLSWHSTACASPDECPLGVFARWLQEKLNQTASESCARVWVKQSLMQASFTVACEERPGFDRERWLSVVNLYGLHGVEFVTRSESTVTSSVAASAGHPFTRSRVFATPHRVIALLIKAADLKQTTDDDARLFFESLQWYDEQH